MIREIRPLDYIAFRNLRALAYRESPLSFSSGSDNIIDHTSYSASSKTVRPHSLFNIVKQSYQLPNHLIAGIFFDQQLHACCTIRPLKQTGLIRQTPQEYNVCSNALNAQQVQEDNISNIAELGGLYVSPNIRRQGQASELLDYCLEHCRRHHFNAIQLDVHKNNQIAFNFYQKYGFVEIALPSNQATLNIHRMKRPV